MMNDLACVFLLINPFQMRNCMLSCLKRSCMYFIRKQVNVLENGVAKEKNKLKLIDAPVYGYWKALYMSFYSRRLYVDIGKRWHGFGLVYLLLAIAVLSLPFALR